MAMGLGEETCIIINISGSKNQSEHMPVLQVPRPLVFCRDDGILLSQDASAEAQDTKQTGSLT